MISFKANLIYNDRQITKYSQTGQCEKYPVSFVRINPTNENDVLALQKTKDIWGKNNA